MDWWPKQLFTTPQHWLTLHTPLWFDMEPVNVISQWHDDWTSASVVNCDLVHNPTICLPGFGLPRRQWCTLLLQNKPRTLWSHSDNGPHSASWRNYNYMVYYRNYTLLMTNAWTGGVPTAHYLHTPTITLQQSHN